MLIDFNNFRIKYILIFIKMWKIDSRYQNDKKSLYIHMSDKS